MFDLVEFSLSSNGKADKNSYKFDTFGLTLSQITLVEGSKVDIYVKFPDDECYIKEDLKVAAVAKSQPNACLHQLEFPTGSVVYCKGSGTVLCVANKPSLSRECCSDRVCKAGAEEKECFIEGKGKDIGGKDKKTKVSDSVSISTSSEIEDGEMSNEDTKRRKVEGKSVGGSKKQEPSAAALDEMITPGYKRKFPSGLKYEVISISKNIRSDIPQIALVGSKVHVKYEGRIAKTGKKFDSGTLSFTVGSGQVVPGFDQGVKGMIVTETRRVFIPSKLGYGAKGCPPVIPKNADLVFEITLLSTRH